jgi:hypothetical protein
MLTALACAALILQPTSADTKPLVEHPHPLITEVLYAVPTQDGDASGDGSREVNGDEFIELFNPHDKPIQLRGYTLSGKGPRNERSSSDGRKFTQLTFTFPALELKPGEVVVVFNGYNQRWKGPVGDDAKAPPAGNDLFHNARVFTMRTSTSKLGLVNSADRVLLSAPGGDVVQCITWGDMRAPEGVKLAEAAPSGKGSATRITATGPMVAHPEIDGRRFSPGRFPAESAGAPANTPPQP